MRDVIKETYQCVNIESVSFSLPSSSCAVISLVKLLTAVGYCDTCAAEIGNLPHRFLC